MLCFLNKKLCLWSIYFSSPSVEKVKGIPMFWATVLQSVDPVSSLIEDEDVSVLKHLTDIRFENITEPLVRIKEMK